MILYIIVPLNHYLQSIEQLIVLSFHSSVSHDITQIEILTF